MQDGASGTDSKQFLNHEQLVARIGHLKPHERRKLLDLIALQKAQVMRERFEMFVRGAWHVLEPDTPLTWNWHLEEICAHLEAVADGRIRRLLINIPPGHCKSLLASVFWPAWIWLQHPGYKIFSASYAMELALRDNDRSRDLIESEWYQKTFRSAVQLARNQNARTYYRNTRHGDRRAFSVGSKTTGFRGNCVLIDDPLNAMDADSDLKRNSANDWLDKAVTSRLNDPRTGAIVIIMQRLHHDDVSGHVLMQGGYEHLCLPSRFDVERAYRTSIGRSDPRKIAGELLFPEIFTEEVLREQETRMGPLAFSGQYQQTPTAGQGNIFKAPWFCQDEKGKKFWPFPSAQIIEAHIAWDTATKADTQHDFTAGCMAVQCVDGYTYILPIFHGRVEAADIPRLVILEWARHRLGEGAPLLGTALHSCHIEENGAGATILQLAKRLTVQQRQQATPPDMSWTQEEWDLVRKAPTLVVTPKVARKSKVERAMEMVPFASSGTVRLVDTALSPAWLQCLQAFPYGVHDDAVDATILALRPFLDLDEERVFQGGILKKMIFKKPPKSSLP